jgi:hypothetical protein
MNYHERRALRNYLRIMLDIYGPKLKLRDVWLSYRESNECARLSQLRDTAEAHDNKDEAKHAALAHLGWDYCDQFNELDASTADNDSVNCGDFCVGFYRVDPREIGVLVDELCRREA